MVTINLGAVRRNFRLCMAKTIGARPAAVLKANGYGLGAVRLAKVLASEGCRDFFVARIGEAVELRRGLRTERPDIANDIAINVLDGLLPGVDPQVLIAHRITPVLNSLEQIHAWNAAAKQAGTRLPGIFQFDSGMNRAGMSAAEVASLAAERAGKRLAHIDIQFVMTHLAKAGEATPLATPQRGLPWRYQDQEPGQTTHRQLANFDAICQTHFQGIPQSVGSSSAVLLGPKVQKHMVRMGGAFHGEAPFKAHSNPFEPVMTLTTTIAQTRRLNPGDAVGYGLKFKATEPMTVATISIGYGDGLPWHENGNGPNDSPNRPYALVAGKFKAPFVGEISMDMSCIDVSGVPQEALKAGTKVSLIGPSLDESAEGITGTQFSDMFSTYLIGMAITLTQRVSKEYVDIDAPSIAGEAVTPPSPHALAWRQRTAGAAS